MTEVSPTTLVIGGNVDLVGTIRYDSGHVPDGTEAFFQAEPGYGEFDKQKDTMEDGLVSARFTATGEIGEVVLSVTVDNETITETLIVEPAKIYLPIVTKTKLNIANPLTNGDFEDGLTSWDGDQGPFLSHGSGLPQVTIDSGEADFNNVALLGNPNYSNGSIPVGYGVISQTFTVEGSDLELQYRVWSRDIVKGSQDKYFDTFEVSVDNSPIEITDADRNEIGCDGVSLNPNKESIEVPSDGGLLFCGGGLGETNILKDTGWLTVTLNLENRNLGEDITLYFTIWSREYEIKYRDDKAYYNTWAWVDNVKFKEP